MLKCCKKYLTMPIVCRNMLIAKCDRRLWIVINLEKTFAKIAHHDT